LGRDKDTFEAGDEGLAVGRREGKFLSVVPESEQLLVRLPNTEEAMVELLLLC
jgi:hypothetical protein